MEAARTFIARTRLAWAAIPAAVAVSSVLFALAHTMHNLPAQVAVTLSGAAFAVVSLRRGVWVSMLAHGSWNALTVRATFLVHAS